MYCCVTGCTLQDYVYPIQVIPLNKPMVALKDKSQKQERKMCDKTKCKTNKWWTNKQKTNGKMFKQNPNMLALIKTIKIDKT